jgi:hypothetical protein
MFLTNLAEEKGIEFPGNPDSKDDSPQETVHLGDWPPPEKIAHVE